MKYYYISHEGPFRNNVVTGKDTDRILRDKNKFIITRIKGRFHVLICRNGVFAKEKLILSYFELVDLLRKSSCNSYFINVSGETVNNILSYVKKGVEYSNENIGVVNTKSFFAIDGGSLLKIEAFVNRETFKNTLDEVYHEEIKDEANVQTIGLIDFVQNSELFELCNYPINERAGKFKVLDCSYSNPNVYYLLCGIYNKDGDKINLNSDDLRNLYLASIMNNAMVNDIIESIDINVVEMYSLDEFSKSIDFVDIYKKQEKDVHIKLISMRNCLDEAKKNTKYVHDLGLLKDGYKMNNMLKKVFEKGV